MIKHAQGEKIKLTMKMLRNNKRIQVKGQLSLKGNGKEQWKGVKERWGRRLGVTRRCSRAIQRR